MYKSIFLPVSSHGDQQAALAFAAALAQGLDGEAEAVFASKSLTLLDAAQRHDVGDVLIKQGYGASQDLLDELYLKQYHEREKSVVQDSSVAGVATTSGCVFLVSGTTVAVLSYIR